MRTRGVAYRLTVAGLTAVLVAGWASPLAGEGPNQAGALPPCAAGVAPVGAEQAAPVPVQPTTGVAPVGAEQDGPACRARATEVISARGGLPRPVPGYHHLGATSAGEWSGVLGRVTVRDPAVRAGTHDFVATRFMAKRQHGDGTAWLEAGWAETGWSGDGRQRIYTYDTNGNAWTFYDDYPLDPGDQVWLYVHTESAGTGHVDSGSAVWQAWLWWRGGWHLLTSQELPLGASAKVEQYVEVYVDPSRDGPPYAVPPVEVDNVQVKAEPAGPLRYWDADVPTSAGRGRGRYCVDWRRRFATWRAGDCDNTIDGDRT